MKAEPRLNQKMVREGMRGEGSGKNCLHSTHEVFETSLPADGAISIS